MLMKKEKSQIELQRKQYIKRYTKKRPLEHFIQVIQK